MKIVCQVCKVVGYLQHIGKNYHRVRHYVGYKHGKPVFKYHRQNPAYARRLLRQTVIDQIDHSTLDPKKTEVSLIERKAEGG